MTFLVECTNRGANAKRNQIYRCNWTLICATFTRLSGEGRGLSQFSVNKNLMQSLSSFRSGFSGQEIIRGLSVHIHFVRDKKLSIPGADFRSQSNWHCETRRFHSRRNELKHNFLPKVKFCFVGLITCLLSLMLRLIWMWPTSSDGHERIMVWFTGCDICSAGKSGGQQWSVDGGRCGHVASHDTRACAPATAVDPLSNNAHCIWASDLWHLFRPRLTRATSVRQHLQPTRPAPQALYETNWIVPTGYKLIATALD